MSTEDPNQLLRQPLEPVVQNEVEQTAPTPVTTLEAGPSKTWDFFGALIVLASSIIALIIVPLIVVIPYFIYLFVVGRPPSAEALIADKTFLLLSIIGVIPAHIVTFGVVWALVSRFGKLPFWKTIQFKWPTGIPHWKTVVFSVGAAVVLLTLGGLVTKYYGGEKTALDLLIESSFQARLATAFLAVATGPLIEELVYRGVIYPALARVIGVTGSIAIVSILFAGVHVYQYKNNLAVIAIISLLSVVLTTTRALTSSVLPGFLIHLVFNGVQSILIVLQPVIENSNKAAPQPAPAIELVIHFFRHFF